MSEHESELSPDQSPPITSRPGQRPIGEPFPYYIPIAQFALRLLGLYLLVIGGTDIISDLVLALTIHWQIGFDDGFVLARPSWIAPFIGSLVYVFVGSYLLMGGQWIIEKVFLTSNRIRSEA